MSEPVNHAVLAEIDFLMTDCGDDEFIRFMRWSRLSERIEFQDGEGEWFEIVVRPIEGP